MFLRGLGNFHSACAITWILNGDFLSGDDVNGDNDNDNNNDHDEDPHNKDNQNIQTFCLIFLGF